MKLACLWWACHLRTMTRSSKSLFLAAAEPSGDQLGANLIEALRKSDSKLDIHGIGGKAMAEQGVSSDFDIVPLAILGFTEAIRAYPVVLKKVKSATDMILNANPDAVVLIDSWGFMVRVAKSLKKNGFRGKIIKYVAPQVWAMREGRAKILARHVDHLLSIHSFDAPYFEKHGLPVTFVGNPMFDDRFSEIKPSKKIHEASLMAVLFGSRPSEIQRLYEPFAEAIGRISQSYPDLEIVAPLSESIADMVKTRAKTDARLSSVKLLPEHCKYKIFPKADLALACSGTVTTQLAMMGVPSVVAYRLSPITALVAKFLFKPDYISLINISAGKALMPEFVQLRCTGKNLAGAIQTFLDDAALRAQTSEDLMIQATVMQGKGGPASLRAASAILDVLAAN